MAPESHFVTIISIYDTKNKAYIVYRLLLWCYQQVCLLFINLAMLWHYLSILNIVDFVAVPVQAWKARLVVIAPSVSVSLYYNRGYVYSLIMTVHIYKVSFSFSAFEQVVVKKRQVKQIPVIIRWLQR